MGDSEPKWITPIIFNVDLAHFGLEDFIYQIINKGLIIIAFFVILLLLLFLNIFVNIALIKLANLKIYDNDDIAA